MNMLLNTGRSHASPATPWAWVALVGAAALMALSASPQAQAAQVGVQVSVHEPGFHGRIVIGDQPPPPVVYRQPVIVQQSPVAVVQQPIYLSVPPTHYQHWAHHCGYWRACGQPVYFVPPGVVYQGRQWGGDRESWRHERHEERRGWRGHDHGRRGHHDHD